MVIVGSKVPEFSTVDTKGNKYTNESLIGSLYILFFYPKDNTPGCTKEACSLRDSYHLFVDKSTSIFGISPDSENSHNKFIEKYQLPFPLLLDERKKMANAFGVWKKKKFMGKEYMGIVRTTFLINKKGVISHIVTKVNTSKHAQQLLDIID